MPRRAIRKTDFGTIILHWALVILLVVAVATGLRIAIVSPDDMVWLHSLDWLLPQSSVWTHHIPAGTLLVGVAVSYAIYLNRARLFRRIRPDLARLSGVAGRRDARLGAFNIILYWLFFLPILVQLGTGILLFLGHAGVAADLHLICTWLILLYVPAHLVMHRAIGGASQLLRIFNPGKLAPAQEAFDPYDLLADLLTREPRSGAHPQRNPLPAHPPPSAPLPRRENPKPSHQGQVLRVHPLTVALSGGFAAIAILMSLDVATRDELLIREILQASQIPLIDGDVSDPVWQSTRKLVIGTQQGANLDGEGGTAVEIRAVHDGVYAYFAFVWDDPTRSLKHMPLMKTARGWRLLQDKFEQHDANAFFEDKFSVLLAPGYVLIPGDRTFHAGRKPLQGLPPSQSGRGFHYTMDDSYVDVWQWRAAEGGMAGWMDDSHFGPPTKPTKAQKDGAVRYTGGFAPDPGSFPFALNIEPPTGGDYGGFVIPKRLPKDLKQTLAAMGTIDLDPGHSESAGARWRMEISESVPYSAEADNAIPVGAIIPGVIGGGNYGADRGHIRCAAHWAAGRWALEVVRRLNTRSKYDVPIKTGSYLRVAVFDHTQVRHTRHIRPIRLEVERCRNHAQCMSTTRDSLPGVGTFY